MESSGRFKQLLPRIPKTWLVTGCAGFIGSHLLEALLCLDQNAVGIDNFATGSQQNLVDVRKKVGEERWRRFRFIEGDICEPSACRDAVKDCEIILHQAALGSVPRSIDAPLPTHRVNVDGFILLLDTAREAGIKRFIYASSSSVYGDHPDLPKREPNIGNALSPYAVTKRVNELYALVFSSVYGLQSFGLRYFNVFGPRQNPDGEYAAVIPRWMQALAHGNAGVIFGDGETSRDFCYIDNVVEANLRAALIENNEAASLVYNIGLGERTTLAQLYEMIRLAFEQEALDRSSLAPQFKAFRTGDVRHSLADISLARNLLGFSPQVSVAEGIARTVRWFINNPG